jgi:hypothetical protein
MVMRRQTSTNKAERVINEMPFEYWIDVKALAKMARLGVRTMSRFLIRAKKVGLVVHKQVVVHSFRISLWKRIV